jgi:hypothetical protein
MLIEQLYNLYFPDIRTWFYGWDCIFNKQVTLKTENKKYAMGTLVTYLSLWNSNIRISYERGSKIRFRYLKDINTVIYMKIPIPLGRDNLSIFMKT